MILAERALFARSETYLCVNIGNTNIQCSVGTKDHNRQAAIPTNKIRCAEDFICFVERQFGRDMWGALNGSIISSVVPSKTPIIEKAICNKSDKPLKFIDTTKCAVDFSSYKSRLGDDRVVCCEAAALKHKLPVIVVDLGTATTFNVVNSENVFLGGAILPGVQTGLTALAQQTAQLPEVNDFSDVRVIGNDTQSNLVSGAIIGAACAIKGYIDRVQAELGKKPTVIITGGNSHLIMSHCDFDFVHEPSLLIDGLFSLYAER